MLTRGSCAGRDRSWRLGARHTPLAAALLLVGFLRDSAAALQATTPPAWRPGDGRGVAALLREVRAMPRKPRAVAPPARQSVTSCADDGSSGSLRAVIAAANDGDVIDLRGLHCSTISLRLGAIGLPFADLTLVGPGAARLAIDGAHADRVFVHYGTGTLTLRAVTVRGGFNEVAGYRIAGGACILSAGYVSLDQALVDDCVAIGEGAYGGAILAHGVTLRNSTLSGSVARGSRLHTLTASYGGGAFAYRGTVNLVDSTIAGNRAEPNPANRYGGYDTGGGLFSDDGGVVQGSTLFGNYTDGSGGGIASHGDLFVGNSTISGNVAGGKVGGGLFLRGGVVVTIANSTLAFNRATRGGGVYLAAAPRAFTLTSSIVADNLAATGEDLDAPAALVIGGANDLVQSAGATIALPPGSLHADPRLLPLAANGGPTLTHALANDSPAIDAGNNTAGWQTDQRGPGYPRVLGDAADIGAFESAPAAAIAAVPSLSSRGRLGLVLLLLGALTGICRSHLNSLRRLR